MMTKEALNQYDRNDRLLLLRLNHTNKSCPVEQRWKIVANILGDAKDAPVNFFCLWHRPALQKQKKKTTTTNVSARQGARFVGICKDFPPKQQSVFYFPHAPCDPRWIRCYFYSTKCEVFFFVVVVSYI